MVVGSKLLRLAVATLVATAAFHLPIKARAAADAPVVIEIKGFKYRAESLNLAIGDVVIWRNLDIVPHTVTASDHSWDSGSIDAGGHWKTVVTATMVRDYYCRFHPTMTATLDIERD
jgi:plastocyanin